MEEYFQLLRRAMRCIFVAFTIWVSANTVFSMPSARRLYYLHTRPATWSSARDTCAKYNGRLLTYTDIDLATVNADIRTLDEKLTDWQGAFSRLTTNVWIGLHKYTENSQLKMMWQGCIPQDVDDTRFAALKTSTTDYCESLVPNTDATTQYATVPTLCTTKLPYICQIDAGQCWFWPMEDVEFKTSVSVTTQSKTVDLNTCAQQCRNATLNGEECWALTANGNADCTLYFTDERHTFLLDSATYFQRLAEHTVYLKVCTGGETTTMAPVTNVAEAIPPADNCTGSGGTASAWVDSVCYCDCDEPPVILEPEDMVLSIDEKVEKIVEELTVNPSNTSAALRKLNSAEDERTSAKSLGALGIAMMSVVFGGLVLLDLNVLISHIHKLLKTGDINSDTNDG